jgi:pimeloyl-ACP methyl ester carboxylesterase
MVSASYRAASGVRWQAIGEGPVVLLLHGLGASSRCWRHVIGPMSDGRRVITLDKPQTARVSDLVDAVGSLAAELGEDSVDLVGHSFGGLIAAQAAATRPGLVRRLVLVAPAGTNSNRRFAEWIGPLAAAALRTTPSHLPRLTYDVIRTGPRSLWATGRTAAQYDIEPFLQRISAPTLIVWGDRDPLLPIQSAQIFKNQIPNARIAIVPGAAHIPMIEQPSIFLDSLLGFLNE